jgi:hypothetical protein
MNDKRKIDRTICNRQVSFLIDGEVHEGTIENITTEGTLILTVTPLQLNPNKEIFITITSADRDDMKKAMVVWVDEQAFGAKFL